MKKIGILTINEYANYGNRLQNYATQELLKSLGCYVETIINTTMHSKNSNQKSYAEAMLNLLRNQSITDLFNKINFRMYRYRRSEQINRAQKKKRENFIQFTRAYINETEYTISDNSIPNDISDRYDFFVAGSDQVWNPIFERFSGVDFLSFSPKHKRIAYAPSFGISELPEEYKNNYKRWLLEMHRLSIRERVGAKIIKEITGRDAEVLVDPTLMLTKEKWLSIAKESSYKPKSKYILTYFLGNQIHENRKSIKRIARENNLEIVSLADIYDIKRYTADPSEFIDYINSASILLTDSFHGAVFSILLEKPFVIFDRIENIASMNSRIDTLLSTFNLSSRKWNIIRNNSDIFNVDYSHVAPILEVERKKALDYLIEALHVKTVICYER